MVKFAIFELLFKALLAGCVQTSLRVRGPRRAIQPAIKAWKVGKSGGWKGGNEPRTGSTNLAWPGIS